MQAMLHGFQRIDMVDRDTGRPVRGFTCFFSYPCPGVTGLKVTKKYVSDEVASAFGWKPEIDHLVNLDFDPDKKLCGISTVREK